MKGRVYAIFAALAAGTILSCAIPTETGEVGALPDQDSFITGKVSQFMENRCAGLDCHGSLTRPLRLFSATGMRLQPNADGTRNNSAITPDERAANYTSVIGLEPELLSVCYTTGKDAPGGCPVESYAILQLLKKPLDISGTGIRHKGGQIIRPGEDDPGWQCLHGWASGQSFPDQCDTASLVK